MLNKYIPLFESNNKLIVCDIQPTYQDFFTFKIHEFISYINSFNDILYLYNDETSNDRLDDIKNWLLEHMDYDEELYDSIISKTTFYAKEFGFFRNLMDSGIMEDTDISKLISHCYKNKISDFRKTNSKKLKKINIPIIDFDLHSGSCPILLIDELVQYKNSIIIGGEKDYCLKEIMLINDALDLKLKKNSNYIY